MKCLAPTAATPSVPTPTPPTTARMERYDDGTHDNNNKDILRCHSYDQPTSQPTNHTGTINSLSPLLLRLNGRYYGNIYYMMKKVSVPLNSQSTNQLKNQTCTEIHVNHIYFILTSSYGGWVGWPDQNKTTNLLGYLLHWHTETDHTKTDEHIKI